MKTDPNKIMNSHGVFPSIIQKQVSINEPDLADYTLDEIFLLVNSIDISECSTNVFHDAYFTSAEKMGINITSGVVGTPEYIADYMVGETVRSAGKVATQLSWYDPCSGSGIFIEAILKKCASENGFLSEENLPEIFATEISPIGIFYCLLAIKRSLSDWGLDLSGYMSSKRLVITLGNSLSNYEESESLLKRYNRHFDVVIGNPPFVRSTRITSKQKQELREGFPHTYSGSANLYLYFISSALSALKPGGILCYISPANFFRSSSAVNLRKHLGENSQLLQLVDLDETPVFPDADIHSAIYWLQRINKKSKSEHFLYSHVKTQADLQKLRTSSIEYEHMPSSGISSKGWTFILKDEDSLNRYSNVISLDNAGIAIYSGIRPGLKKAFIWERSELTHLSPEMFEEWFKPTIGARNIAKWASTVGDKLILFIPHETVSIPSEIESLLQPFQSDLIDRHSSKGKSKWYSLRPCSYYDLFERKRIVFPDISSQPRFSLDQTNNINLDGSLVIDSSDTALLGVLNSEIAWKYFIDNCPSIGNAKNKGRLRLKKAHVGNFPIPKTLLQGCKTSRELSTVVEEMIIHGENPTLLRRLNSLVNKLYAKNQ